MMRALRNIFWVAFLLIALGVSAAWAQQPTPDQQQTQGAQQPQDQAATPIPAYHSPLASAAGDDESESQPLAPDTTPLSGAQNLSLGIETTHSYWQPYVNLFATANSNADEAAQGSGWTGGGSVSGGVNVHRLSGNSNMTLSYTSGATFSNESDVGNGVVQGLNFSDKFSFRRWSLSLFDQMRYLPQSSFGFGGLGGGLDSGVGSSGLGSTFESGQSILIGQGQNLENSFVTEVDMYLTPRSSLTFTGGYSLLHYFDSGLLDYGDANFRFGYNYQMTRKDTIAVFYTFSGFRYSNSDQSITTHTVQASYGRRVTGRLAFQIAGGPQIVISRFPIASGAGSSGEGGTGTTAPTSATQVYAALNAAVQWQAERTNFALTYNHGVSGGSGVFAGSVSNIVTGSVTRQVSRTFSSGILGGYSRNSGTATGMGTPSNQTYDYWFGGGSLSHPVGRAVGLTLSYQLQYQNSNGAFCIGPTCGKSVLVNLVSFGVGWHERPLLF